MYCPVINFGIWWNFIKSGRLVEISMLTFIIRYMYSFKFRPTMLIVLHVVDCTYCVMHGWLNADYPSPDLNDGPRPRGVSGVLQGSQPIYSVNPVTNHPNPAGFIQPNYCKRWFATKGSCGVSVGRIRWPLSELDERVIIVKFYIISIWHWLTHYVYLHLYINNEIELASSFTKVWGYLQLGSTCFNNYPLDISVPGTYAVAD